MTDEPEIGARFLKSDLARRFVAHVTWALGEPLIARHSELGATPVNQTPTNSERILTLHAGAEAGLQRLVSRDGAIYRNYGNISAIPRYHRLVLCRRF